ncbi:MAG: hypothetical protein V1493_06110, partial [Candidatus Diapherotrites archaeon]
MENSESKTDWVSLFLFFAAWALIAALAFFDLDFGPFGQWGELFYFGCITAIVLFILVRRGCLRFKPACSGKEKSIDESVDLLVEQGRQKGAITKENEAQYRREIELGMRWSRQFQRYVILICLAALAIFVLALFVMPNLIDEFLLRNDMNL